MRHFIHSAHDGLIALLPDVASSYVQFAIRFRQLPRLKKPKTFNEKLLYQKLFVRDSRLLQLADKIAVKGFVSELMGAEWVIPTLWYGKTLPAKRDWPLPVIIKPNHGSGWYRAIRHHSDLNEIDALCGRWLAARYDKAFREWFYGRIDPQLMVEPLIGGGGLPTDYKFFVFNGHVEFIQVHTDRATEHKATFYDRKWMPQPFTLGSWPLDQRRLLRPKSLGNMIDCAEKLSLDFPFVRIDLYEIEGKPYFGEYTFFPEAGLGRFNPPSHDLLLGEMWP
jgi:hypothetical protein